MNNHQLIQRLRDANPAEDVAIPNASELFDAIVASAPAHRVRPQRRTRRAHVPWKAAALVASFVAVGATTVWAATTATDVLNLFNLNRAGRIAPGEEPIGLWKQVAIPESVQRAGTIPIPSYGTLEFWTADTRQGGWCGAIRLPSGKLAGADVAEKQAAQAPDAGDAGGAAPGCYPSRAQANEAGDPVYVLTGFDNYETNIDVRDKGGSFWRVVYGVTELEEPAARIVDTISGRDAAVLDGRFFALAVQDAHPEQPPASPLYHLVAYDAAGKVIADADRALASASGASSATVGTAVHDDSAPGEPASP